jgi:hypothetical protein
MRGLPKTFGAASVGAAKHLQHHKVSIAAIAMFL